jgi:predicted glycoside hydrolase/deacetylase ChbG (UPF0249 family)
MKRLIVNAANFGLSTVVNRAVIEAFQKGVLTSASLLVGKPATEEAVSMAKDNSNLGIGVQLSLTEFLYVNKERGVATFYWDDSVPIKKIIDSVKMQIEEALSTGLPIDHVNSTWDIHLRPELVYIICSICSEYNIKNIRFYNKYYEVNYPGMDIGIIKKFLSLYGFKYPEHFIDGWYYGNLDTYTEGTAELRTFPAYYDARGEEELKVLLNPEVKKYIEEVGIQLITFKEL